MKIVIASGIYPPDSGGPATYSQLIAREFSDQGIEVDLICYGDKYEENDKYEKFRIIRILRKQNTLKRYLNYFKNLFKLAKNADIIYAQGPLSAGLPAMLISKILKKKFIIKIVGDYAWEQYQNEETRNKKQETIDLIDEFQNKKYDWKTELRRKIQKKVVGSAGKVIVPSEYLKKIVVGWGINADKIIVIYNAFRGVEDVAPEKLEGDVIISAGRPEPWKGFDTLKEILPDLLKENPNFRLIIETKMPHKELMARFKGGDIFVLNTGYEGLSHLLLEAMACGLPIITTSVCGNPEVIENEFNGLLVRYNDKEQLKNAILRLWKDEDLRKKFIENGYKKLKQFELKRMINETIKALMPAQGGSASGRKLLMITGDRALAGGKHGPFYYMLEEFSKSWERIDIICPRTEQKIDNIFGNVFIHSSNLPLILQPWFVLKKGTEIFKQQKFDLFTIHSYPPFYNDVGGLWLHKKIKTPYLLEIMHITGYPKAGNCKEWFYKILTKIFIKKFTKNARAVRVINQNQVPEFLIKFKIDKEKIKYVPAFYIDLDIFKPINLEKKYDIVFSGRLVKNKGIFLLLRAIANSKLKTLNPKLIIVGDGPLKPKIEKFIKKNNLQNNIEFSGWLPTTNDVAGIYNQSRLMAMLSFNEGGPRVTLEAMACKIPVLTSRVGIMNDIIKDMENGIFVDWKIEDIVNKIMLLLKDDNLRNKIAENGYQTVQQFERKKAIENYALTYQRLISSKFDVRSSDSDN